MVITLNGRELASETIEKLCYASFTETTPLIFTISFEHTISDIVISPPKIAKHRNLDGNTVEITLSRPAPFFVRELSHPDSPHIFLWPKTTHSQVQDSVVCTQFGIESNGALQTVSIQHALDELSVKGGILRFPAGVYKTGTLEMRSHVTIALDEGAVLRGSDDPRDYPVDKGYQEEGTNGEYMTFSRLILFDGVNHAGITGEGTIDGVGAKLRSLGCPANLIRIKNSDSITISDIILRDAAAWCVHILHSNSVTVSRVKILNALTNRNTDGVDPDSSRSVLIEDCFMYCGDDCVVVKTTRNSGLLRASENIIARNNMFYTLKAAQKIGTESFADIRDVLFTDNYIISADRAMGLYNCDGGVYDDIRFHNNTIESATKTMEIQTVKRNGLGTITRVTVT